MNDPKPVSETTARVRIRKFVEAYRATVGRKIVASATVRDPRNADDWGVAPLYFADLLALVGDAPLDEPTPDPQTAGPDSAGRPW